MNTISSQIQHTQERHKDYKNLFSTVNICSQDQQERKEKTVAVRETGWRIETMPYQIKNLKIKGKTERN